MLTRPFVADTVIAFVMVCVAVLLGRESETQGWPDLDTRGAVLASLAHLPVAFRSRMPLVVFGMTQIASAAFVTVGYWPVVVTFGPMLALYTVASVYRGRTAVACGGVLVSGWLYSGMVSESRAMLSVFGQALLFSGVLVWFGALARRSAELSRQLREEQAERARREVAEERGRIARELHDVVAHHMSVISVQAGLARFVFATDPATARTALGTIADTSGESLDELRRILKVLREEDVEGMPGGATTPLPGVDRLDELIDRARAGGVPVELHIKGTPRPLAPGVGLCAYRVVQEALTNVLKHARNAATTVEIHYRRHHVTVTVTDDGKTGEGLKKGPVSDGFPTGSGHGLIGMRERAALYGGQISMGPRDQGGFVVRMTLPTSGRTAVQRDDAAT